jgi:hypothetical protein
MEISRTGNDVGPHPLDVRRRTIAAVILASTISTVLWVLVVVLNVR